MESSIAEFLKRKLACELLPTLDCVVLTGAELCCAVLYCASLPRQFAMVKAGLVCDCRAAARWPQRWMAVNQELFA